jgi:uncharacterized protein YggE
MEEFMQWFVRRVVVHLVPAALAAVLVSAPADRADAQATPVPAPPPYISASAIGEARVVPDRAMVSVAVESQGTSAAKAGADNAARQTRVIDAVKAVGIAAAQIRTSGYNVFPEYAQSDEKGPRISGYRAHNTVQVEVRAMDLVGKVIDAALAAGATNIGGVSLFASNTDAPRKEALQQAVAKARTEAEAVATAAGGSLGPLAELAIEPVAGPQPLVRQKAMFSARAGAAATPIETGEIVVQAMVRVRWQFVPGRR